MPLGYLFKQLLLPPGGLFLLLLLVWWWRLRRPRLALACGVLGLGGLWLMSLPVVVEQAARLHWASGLPILASGGLHFGAPPSEAELFAQVLQEDFSVMARWQEGRSRTTWENAALSAPLLRDAGVRRIVLVTQAWHMPRARWCFERHGFEVVPAPLGFLGVPNGRPLGGWLPESKALWQSGLLLHEAAGLLLYPLLYR